MKYTTNQELAIEIDRYEMFIAGYSEIVPTIGFTVLQAQTSPAILRHDVRTSTDIELSPLNAVDSDAMNERLIVTMRRQAADNYTLGLTQSADGVFMRSEARIQRTGARVAVDGVLFDRQGVVIGEKVPSVLLHAVIAIAALQSPLTKERILAVENRRMDYETRLQDATLSLAEVKQIKSARNALHLK
jgi:hypothetical protein